MTLAPPPALAGKDDPAHTKEKDSFVNFVQLGPGAHLQARWEQSRSSSWSALVFPNSLQLNPLAHCAQAFTIVGVGRHVHGVTYGSRRAWDAA